MTQGWPPRPKILYAFQGTGNGHSARANVIIDELKKWADVKVLCSGVNHQLSIDHTIDFQLRGISFEYNVKGGLDYLKTIKRARFIQFMKDVIALDLSSYDLVINDFEPVSAWSAKLKSRPILGMGHQASFKSAKVPRPFKRRVLPEWILRNYAPTKEAIGFHFKSYDDFIFPAVLRQELLESKPVHGDYFVCYLPAYSNDEIYKVLHQISNREFRIFSKDIDVPEQRRNCLFEPISSSKFLEAMMGAEGVLCSAGFETPAEALYLSKKLLVIPIQGQYEQYCNAAALRALNVTVLKSLKEKYLPIISNWIYDGEVQKIEVVEDLGIVLRTEVLKRLKSPSKRLASEC